MSAIDELRPLAVGEIIQKGDFCYDVVRGLVPAAISVGRKVRPENRNYVFTKRLAS